MLGIGCFKTPEVREKVKASEKKRFKDESVVDEIYKLYTQRIKLDLEINKTNKQINSIQRQIGIVKAQKSEESTNKNETEGLINERETLLCVTNKYKEDLKIITNRMDSLLISVGNIIENDVPVCRDESGNRILRQFESTLCTEAKKDYSELMNGFTRTKEGANVIGHRGYYLEDKMALLGRALKNYAVDFLLERGFRYIQPPVMMRGEVMGKTAQLSDFDEQLYRIGDDSYLIATSEQPLTALFQNVRLCDSDLPKMLAGESLCFRKEAGAYGKDNAGIFRVHQFEKIEQFIVCKPEESAEFLEKMIKTSEEFYKSLNISFRVVVIASGELNDAASKKYDLEALFPKSGRFRELVSASNCTDYQSRNLNCEYNYNKGSANKQYVHMLNATLCAVQRTLCCVVENYQTDDGITVPDVLKKYTGFDFIKLTE